MEFKKRKLSFKFDGEKYSVDYPSKKQAREYLKSIQSAKGEEVYDRLSEYLEGLGLPLAVSDEMELEHLKQIGQELHGLGKS